MFGLSDIAVISQKSTEKKIDIILLSPLSFPPGSVCVSAFLGKKSSK